MLKPGGSFVVKARYGDEYGLLRRVVTAAFKTAREVKPPASRAESAEAYLVGIGLNANALRALLMRDELVTAALAAHGLAVRTAQAPQGDHNGKPIAAAAAPVAT